MAVATCLCGRRSCDCGGGGEGERVVGDREEEEEEEEVGKADMARMGDGNEDVKDEEKNMKPGEAAEVLDEECGEIKRRKASEREERRTTRRTN